VGDESARAGDCLAMIAVFV